MSRKTSKHKPGPGEYWPLILLMLFVGMHYGLTMWQIVTGGYTLLFVWYLVKGGKK